MKTANIAAKSNLMPDEEWFKPEYRFLPGDFVTQVYPNFRDVRAAETKLSAQQKIELTQYLVCLRCGKPCAGTCVTLQSRSAGEQ